MRLLCSECELLLADWERPFAESVFMPLHTKEPTAAMTCHYGEWGLRFAASVAWRVVQFYKENNDLDHLSSRQQGLLREAEEAWRCLLVGDASDVGGFDLHMIPFDELAPGTSADDLSRGINRYMLRSVDLDIAASDDAVVVYAKLVKIALFGLVQVPHPEFWSGGHVQAQGGELGTGDYQLPEEILEYMNYRAEAARGCMEEMSEEQHAKIVQATLADGGYHLSEAFRAIAADVGLFGSRAFKRGQEEE